MREKITKFDLDTAFKALDEIGYETPKGGVRANKVNLKETFTKKLKTDLLVEDYYDIGDEADLEEAKDAREDEIAKAKLARIEKIVDLDANSPDELLGSYAGKYIIQCPQCMTLFYKDKQDIEESEDDPNTVNVNETCQHCGNNSGYTLIGKVAPISQEEANNYAEAEADNLDLNFEEPEEENEEEAPQEEEAPAEENNEEAPEDNLDEFNLNLEDTTEEKEEEKKEESLEASNSTPLNESAEDCKDGNCDIKDEENPTNESLADGHADSHETKIIDQLLGILADDYAIDTDKLAELAKRAGMTEKEVQAFIYGNIEESLNNSEALKDAEKESELATENASENTTLNEAKRDDDDYYGRDIDDAVIQLKKTGHAEFWCRADGKKKADEVVKIVKDKYGKDVEYTIEDDLCSAKVVKEDLETEELATESLNNSEAQAEAEEKSDLATENKSENTTLNEEAIKEETLGDVEFTEADMDNLIDKELSKPITDDEVQNIITDEALDEDEYKEVNFEADFDDIDEEVVESLITESLTKVYKNVQSFKLNECTIDENNNLVFEGLITFKSEKTKPARYVFTEAKANKTTAILTGTNEALGTNSKFTLTGLLESKNLKPQSFEYNYVVNSQLVEGLIKR